MKAENSKLRKELIIAMDNGNRMKEWVKALTDDLKVEKLLTEQKDEQLQATKREVSRLRMMMCKPSNLLTSTTAFCSASTSRVSSYQGGT